MAGKRKERQGIILYYDHLLEARNSLTEQEQGRLLSALFDYAFSGIEPKALDTETGMLFRIMKRAVDRDEEKYEQTCERNRERARKRRAQERGEGDCAQEQEEDGGRSGADDARGMRDEPDVRDVQDVRDARDVRGVRDVREVRGPAANRTELNQTEQNQTKQNRTEQNQTERARGAPASALYGRRGKGRREATVTGGVCGDPIPWA